MFSSTFGSFRPFATIALLNQFPDIEVPFRIGGIVMWMVEFALAGLVAGPSTDFQGDAGEDLEQDAGKEIRLRERWRGGV